MNCNLARLLAAATAVLGSLVPTSAQNTVSMPADKDATLYEEPNGLRANDAGPSFFIGRVSLAGGETRRRALIHFDVASAVPAGATIIAARIEMFAAQSISFFPIQTFGHRVTSDWDEGSTVSPGQGGQGGTSQNGDTTWLHSDFPSTLWNNVGGDFAATPSFTTSMPGVGFWTVESSPGMVADLQSWLDAPATNFGWLLKTDEALGSTARRINSREATGLQPELFVSFLMPGDTGTVGQGWPVGTGTFDLSVNGVASGGSTLNFDLFNAPASSLGAWFFSLELDATGLQLLPGCDCNVYLSPFSPLIPGDAFVVPASGIVNSTFLVPNVPGVLLATQAAVLDATPLGFSLSNAGVLVTQ